MPSIHLKHLAAAGSVGLEESTTHNSTGALLRVSGKVKSTGASNFYAQVIAGRKIAQTLHAEMVAILNSSSHARRAMRSLFAKFGEFSYCEKPPRVKGQKTSTTHGSSPCELPC